MKTPYEWHFREMGEEDSFTCDWGDCDEFTVMVRRDGPSHGPRRRWLSVCWSHLFEKDPAVRKVKT